MSPKTQYPNTTPILVYRINKAVFYVYPPGICAFEVSNQFLIRWRILKRIVLQNLEQLDNIIPQPCLFDHLNVLYRLFCKLDFPHHHSISLALTHSSGSAFIPSIIDSRIPGILRRYKVSWIAR